MTNQRIKINDLEANDRHALAGAGLHAIRGGTYRQFLVSQNGSSSPRSTHDRYANVETNYLLRS